MVHAKHILRPVFLATFGAFIAACNAPETDSGDTASFAPIDPNTAIFWDRQTTETADLLGALVAEFNASREALPLKVEQTGNYGDIYRKVTASIRAGSLPAMAVVYETMIPEYAAAGAIVPLDDLINHPETGLSDLERDDFFPALLESNTFDELGGKMFSFPYTKSVLMLFFNKRVLAEAGIDGPPNTWDVFLDQCRTIKAKTGKHALAIDVDPSTVDGMIYAMGGDILDGRKTRFDSPEAIRVFELFDTLVKEGLAYQIPPRTFNDETAFGQDQIAFSFRTSASRPHFGIVMEDDSAWGMSAIPQADPANPATVVYGGNVCIFDTTPGHVAAAWDFIRFFTSPDVNVRWALGTGYLPVRKSAVDDPRLQAFWSEWPYNRAAFDCLAYARPEPNIQGWQDVRPLIADALTAVINGLKTPHQAASDLKTEADAVLADVAL